MAVRAPRPCNSPACRALSRDGSGYCPAHVGEKVNWESDKRRGSRHQRGYGSAWTRLRAQVLARDKRLCQAHKSLGRYVPGNEVDHIVPKSEGGTDDMDNLQTLCNACHRTKTAEDAARGRAAKTAQGAL